MSPFLFAFVAFAFFAIYVQTRSHTLAWVFGETDEGAAPQSLRAEYHSLLRIRRVTSPLIAASTGALILAATFAGAPLAEGRMVFLAALFGGVWLTAGAGDIFIEGAYSIQDPRKQERFYFIGMLLFIAFTLGLGAGLIYHALHFEALNPGCLAAAVVVSCVCGGIAFLTLKVSRETLPVMLVYLAAVTTLLCGGIVSAMIGDAALAYIGIAYFVSDWCVGLRDFGKRVPALLARHILIVILMLYYSIMLTSLQLFV